MEPRTLSTSRDPAAVDYWNDSAFAGNGNGFKVGGNSAQANHKLTNCVSFGNVHKGFDQNNNTGGGQRSRRGSLRVLAVIRRDAT